MDILHSTNLMHIHEGITQNDDDLKVLVSSDEQQFRNSFVFFISPEMLKLITGKDDCLFLLDEPDTHLNPYWQRSYVQLLNQFNLNDFE